MMRSYTVKNYLWSMVLLVGAVIALTGCSSTPTKTAQFCNTSKTVEVQNGSQVSSKTVVKCSDDFLDRHVPARAGIDRNCQETINQFVLNGKVVERRGFACETHRPGRIIYITDPQNM